MKECFGLIMKSDLFPSHTLCSRSKITLKRNMQNILPANIIHIVVEVTIFAKSVCCIHFDAPSPELVLVLCLPPASEPAHSNLNNSQCQLYGLKQ